MTQNAVMAGSEGACSLDDDLATTTTEDGSLDTILKQLEAEKRRMAALGAAAAAAAAAEGAQDCAVRKACVPLAEPEEEFLDDAASSAGNNTDADVPNVPTSENVTPSDDVFLGSGPDVDVIIMSTEMPTEEVASSSCDREDDDDDADDDESAPASPLSPRHCRPDAHCGNNGGARVLREENNYNGMGARRGLHETNRHRKYPLPPIQTPSPTTQVDMDTDPFAAVNSNGLARSKKWLDFRIAELETLDWEGVDMDTDLNTDYDMLEFADKYYNVQIATGYTGAISKTVNMVRRRSLTVSVIIIKLLTF